MKRYLRFLGPLLVVAVFIGAVWLLDRELRQYRLHDVIDSLSKIGTGWFLLAVALSALNYAILVGYDLMATRHIGHPLPLGKVALASFLGYTSSFNFGPLLGATAVRYRIYSSLGLSTIEIVKVVAILSLSF
jgi:phosphatidylglycerol lysyltransferase